jgi:hypothetical protein
MPVSIQHGGDSTIARLESGRISPSMKTWRRLAAATGTRPKVTLRDCRKSAFFKIKLLLR